MVNPFAAPPQTTDKEALQLTREELNDRKGSDFTSYSNGKGSFFLEGLEIIALIPGKGFFGQSMHVVCKMSKENFEWYCNALRIIMETCDYVMKQDTTDYYLCWSG